MKYTRFVRTSRHTSGVHTSSFFEYCTSRHKLLEHCTCTVSDVKVGKQRLSFFSTPKIKKRRLKFSSIACQVCATWGHVWPPSYNELSTISNLSSNCAPEDAFQQVNRSLALTAQPMAPSRCESPIHDMCPSCILQGSSLFVLELALERSYKPLQDFLGLCFRFPVPLPALVLEYILAISVWELTLVAGVLLQSVLYWTSYNILENT